MPSTAIAGIDAELKLVLRFMAQGYKPAQAP
jgi:hypothetical protein